MKSSAFGLFTPTGVSACFEAVEVFRGPIDPSVVAVSSLTFSPLRTSKLKEPVVIPVFTSVLPSAPPRTRALLPAMNQYTLSQMSTRV